MRRLRLVATVRNKVVHESARMDDKPRFITAADAAERELAAIVKGRRGRGIFGKIKLLAVLIVIGAVAAIALWWWMSN